MPSNWYNEFMRLNGFDIEDPYFDNKLASFTPAPRGLELDKDKDVTDYFESGGEYDKAAGDATGLWGNTLDLGLRVGKGLVGGLVGAAGVVTDLADTAATGISDLTGLQKGGLFADATASARNFNEQADIAVSEGMAMPKNDFTLADPLGNYKSAEDGIGGFLSATGKTVQDIAYSGAEIGADMAGAAAAGYAMGGLGFQGGAAAGLAEGASIGAKALAYGKDVLASNVSKGFQMSGFADMYETHTQNKEDSRLKAIGISAPYSQFTGLLEGIGAVETFGEKAVSKYLIGDSVTSWVGRRAVATALGATSEGATEYPQQWAQILAEELPSNSVNDKDPMSAWDRVKQRSPEAWQAALGGALFGGPVGGFMGIGKAHAADADAKVADAAKNGINLAPDQAVAEIVNGKDTPLNTVLAGMAEVASAPVIESVAVGESTANLADQLIAAATNRDKLVDEGKKETLDALTYDIARIQQATEQKTEEITGGLLGGIQSVAQAKLSEFDNIVIGLQNLQQSMATGKPQQITDAPDQDSTDFLTKLADRGINPQQMAQAIAKRFEDIGVNPEVFANGFSGVDFNAVRSEFEQSLIKDASNNVLPMVTAIEQARGPEPDSVVAQNIEAVKQQAGPQESPVNFYTKAIEAIKGQSVVSVVFLQRSLNIGFQRASSLMAQLESDKLVSPKNGNKPRQVLLSEEERMAPAKDVLKRAPSMAEPESATEKIASKLIDFTKQKIAGNRKQGNRFDAVIGLSKSLNLAWLTKPFRLTAEGSPTVEDVFSPDPDTYQSIKEVHGAADKQGFASAIVKKIRSTTNVSEAFHNTYTVPFANAVADAREVMDAATKLPENDPNRNHYLESSKDDIAKLVTPYRRQLARQSLPPGIARSMYDVGQMMVDTYQKMTGGELRTSYEAAEGILSGGKSRFIGNDAKAAAKTAGEWAPAARIVSMWLYSHSNGDLSKRVVAKMLGEQYTLEQDNQLATDLAEALNDDGLYDGLSNEDQFVKRAFLDSIVEQGKTVSSPHGLYIALVKGGEAPEVAISIVSTMQAASINNANKTGGTLTDFWDTLATRIMSFETNDKTTINPGGVYNPANSEGYQNWSGENISLFAAASINVLASQAESSRRGIKNGMSLVMQHELMHALHETGLLLNIVGADGIRAIEQVTGPLYDSNGNAIDDKVTAEKLAVAWEIFLATQQAPNAETQSAFDTAKNFFRTYLNFVFKMFEKEFDIKLWEVKQKGAPLTYVAGKDKAGKNRYGTYSVLSNKLLANQDAIQALYRIITVQPETGAHMATGGSTGATGALVSAMSDITGIDMSGAMDQDSWNTSIRLATESTSWIPESGKAPTDAQLHSMLGYDGMNEDDAGVRASTKWNKENTGRRLKIWADSDRVAPIDHGPFLRKPTINKVESKKQQVAAKLLEKSGALRSSHDAETWLESIKNALIGGKNPALNNEEFDASSISGVKTLMTEHARLWRKFVDYKEANGTMAAIGRALPYIGNAHLRSIVNLWTKGTSKLADVYEPLEAAIDQLGLPSIAMNVNNMFSLSHWAEDITERIPQYFDRTVGKNGDWVNILGAESWRNISNDFMKWRDAYYERYKNDMSSKTKEQFDRKTNRDIKLWMLAQRELEIFDNAAKAIDNWRKEREQFEQDVRDGKAAGEGPKPPKIPKISEAAVSLAKNVVSILKSNYGEDIHALDMISMRYSKWETDSKLVPLLKANLITSKQYADIVNSGMRHVPFARVRELVEASGAVNPNIDGSMYEVLDYLKGDLAYRVQDPLGAAVASVQAINMLVQRQIAKNAIGEAVKKHVPVGTRDGAFVILHSKKKITKERYDALPDERRQSAKEEAGDSPGQKATKYYEIVPATKEDIGNILSDLRNRIKGLEGKKKKEAEILINGGIFAAYLEPGVPTYIRILDTSVADAFNTMNNPQVMYATNAFTKAVARTQRWFKGQYVTSPQFIYNQLFRDIPNAIFRSNHGLRLTDIARGIVASLDMAGFEGLAEAMSPEGKAQGVANDALKGFGPFGGLISGVGPGGDMDIDLMIAASHDGLNTRNSNLLKQSYDSYVGNMKKHGAIFPSLQQVSQASKAGDWKVVGKNALLVPKLVFSIPRAFMSVPGSVLENAPRLAERRLMMDIDMQAQYPQLVARFPELYTPDGNGKILAGYAGSLHRRRWEAIAKRLKVDPNAIVAKEDLPIQYGAAEKDFDTRHITLPFDQKGKWTPMIDLGHIFFGPAMLDMYTNIKQIGNNSLTQGIADRLYRTDEQVAERKSKLNYNERGYTDQDGRALAMLVKAVAVITIPALAQALIYKDDDEWQAQSFAEKLSYYHIKTPWGRMRIARGLGFMQLLFSDLPTAAILEFSGKDPLAFSKWGKRFFQSTPLGAVMAGPVAFASGMGGAKSAKIALGEVTPEILKGSVEAIGTDYDTYRDKQVSYETGFAPEDETRVKSDRFNILANLVARIEGVQPAQAQHQIAALFPGTKKIIPWLANKATETAYGATGGLPTEVEASNAPIYGQGTGSAVRVFSKSPFGVGNEYVQSLYKLDRILTGYKNSADKMSETSKKVYESQHPELKYADIISSAVDMINTDQDRIRQLRKEGINKGDNSLTEYDLNKKMTMQAMETYRLFYGKLMGD